MSSYTFSDSFAVRPKAKTCSLDSNKQSKNLCTFIMEPEGEVVGGDGLELDEPLDVTEEADHSESVNYLYQLKLFLLDRLSGTN
jgi:hypothetical protein